MFRELLNSINNSPSEDKPRSHLCLYLEFCGSFTSHQSLFIGRCYSFIVRWTIVQGRMSKNEDKFVSNNVRQTKKTTNVSRLITFSQFPAPTL